MNCKRCVKLEKALSDLIDLYVANRGKDGEFITCITPKSAHEMTFFERKQSKTWVAWDEARILLGEK